MLKTTFKIFVIAFAAMFAGVGGVAFGADESCYEFKAECLEHLREEAEQGKAAAQVNLGWMYANGEGVEEDKREAVRWYRLSAEQGNTNAQYNLGVMYSEGEGIAKDKREAVRWFRLAAEQGDADAQYHLSDMYNLGEGVIEDEYEAYIWYLIAKASGAEITDEDRLRQEFSWQFSLTSQKRQEAKQEAKKRFKKFEEQRSNKQSFNNDSSQKGNGESRQKTKTEQLAKAEEELLEQTEEERAVAWQKLIADQAAKTKAKTARVSYLDNLKAGYMSRIIGRIEDYLITPPSAKSDVLVVLEVKLDLEGSVIGLPSIAESSGIEEYDSAAVRAVLQAAPLPMPKDEKLIDEFRFLRLHISPKS